MDDRRQEALRARYGQSEGGHFWVSGTIGVPHPYCIMPRHVQVAADYHGGILDKGAVEDAEKRGAHCCTCRGQLKYAEHETALLVRCRAELKIADAVNPELHAYLLKCKSLAEADGYAGFAFVEAP